MQLSAIILAGGESTRMGRDKAWIPCGDRPLIELAVNKLRTLGVEQLFVSGRPGGDYSALECPVLFDLEPGTGPLGGIERGLHKCRSPLLLVLAVDLPHMTTEFLQRLAARCDRLTGCVPSLRDGLEPLAAIYPKRCHALAVDSLAKLRRSARDFAAAALRERAVRTFPLPPADSKHFINWNCPADMVPDPPRQHPPGNV